MTIKEIASLAGVSISTVSKIVNNKDTGINPQTRERVLKIVKEYRYKPYASAMKANQTKTFLIGLLVSSPDQIKLLLPGILEQTMSDGYHLIPCLSYGNHETELKHIATLCNHHVDAVIWEPLDEESLSYESHFSDAAIPVIHIGYEKEEFLHIDFSGLGYEMSKQVTDLGHHKIVSLVSPGNLESLLVAEGFKKCLFDLQIPFQESMICDSGCQSLLQKIGRHEITCVLCPDFETGSALYGMLKKLKYQVPTDLSIIALRENTSKVPRYPGIACVPVPYLEFGRYLSIQAIRLCEQNLEAEKCFSFSAYLESRDTIDIPYSSNEPHILVVGSINLDTYLNVDSLPQFGRTVTTTRSSTYPGGKGTNQAIGAARLGHRVSIIGMVGHDPEGDRIYSSLLENQIEVTGVIRRAEYSTGHAYIYLQPDGNSMISILAGANAGLTPKDIFDHRSLFERAGYLLIQTEIPRGCVTAACRLAKKHGVRTILKPSTLSSIDEELLLLIDILVPNEAELHQLCPCQDTLEEKAHSFIERGLPVIIVTLDANGCFYMDQHSSRYYPAAAFPSVDTTGASDAFISALASYLLSGYSMDQAIRTAVYAAGFSISRQGVTPALIDKNTLESGFKIDQ